MRCSILVILLFVASCTAETGKSDKKAEQASRKADCEAVVNAVLPFAKEMLAKHQTFHPFGGTVSADGTVAMAAGWTGEERPAPTEVIEVLRTSFRQGAKEGKYRATAIAIDIRTVPPGKTEKQDAIAVQLEHRDDYSVTVVFPYSFDSNGALEVEQSFKVRSKAEVFVQ